MTEKGTLWILYPQLLERVPDCLETIGRMSRDGLAQAGCVVEMNGIDLTSWDFQFVPEHFDDDLGELVPDAFHITAIAPMPDAVEIA